MKRISSFFLFMICILGFGILAPPVALEAGANGPIIIGVPTSLGYPPGKEALNSVIMAVEEINAKGGVKVGATKRKLKVESADIRDAAPGVPVPEALLGLEKIILDKKVHAIVVGPYRSEALLAGMDIIAKYKVPMLGTIAMSPASEAKIKKEPDKYKYIFRIGQNAKTFIGYQMGIMKYLEREFGFNRVYAMYQDVMWARKSAEILTMLLGKAKWEILGNEAYPAGATDYSPGLMKARAAGAQIIFPVFDLPQAGVLVKQWRSMKVPALMAGMMAPISGADSWETYDRKIAGAINMVMEIGNVPVPKVPASVQYYEAYKKRWGKEIQEQHAPVGGYEAVYVLAEALERAGTMDPDTVAAALEKTDRMGAMGRIRFDEGHQTVFGNDPSEKAMGCVIQWREGGKRVVVYPESIAEDKIQLPSWLKPAK
jgi:branched-chain amino acid transport system substrate-binding protein